MIADKNANISDSFKKSSDLIDRVNSLNKQPLILFQMQKRMSTDTENEVNDCNHKTTTSFLKALTKEIRDAFNFPDNLPVLLATMALDLHDIPSKEDDSLILMGMTRLKPFLTSTVTYKTMCLTDMEDQVLSCSYVHRNC